MSSIKNIWLEIKPSKSANILVCTVYRPEDERIPEWNVKFGKEMESAYIENKEIILMGDSNINFLRYDKVTITWTVLIDVYSLTLVIEEPTTCTRVTPQRQSLLDHMNVMRSNNIRQWSVLKSGMSDRFPTSMVHKTTTVFKGHHVIIHYRSTKDLDSEKLTAHLEKVPWSILDCLMTQTRH